jgi:hypothetical protein
MPSDEKDHAMVRAVPHMLIPFGHIAADLVRDGNQGASIEVRHRLS